MVQLNTELCDALTCVVTDTAFNNGSIGHDAGLCTFIPTVKLCKQPNYIFDFSFRNMIPWKGRDYGLVDGETPVVFNMRSVMFTSIFVSSVLAYLWKEALRS